MRLRGSRLVYVCPDGFRERARRKPQRTPVAIETRAAPEAERETSQTLVSS